MTILRKTLPAVAAGLLALAAVPAHADVTLFSSPDLMPSFSGSAGSVDAIFSAPAAGDGSLRFQLGGYESLDGVNCCTDVFRLSVNGSMVFEGSFNMGGGGVNTVWTSPAGASVLVTTFGASDDPHNSTQVTWAGGIADISIPIALQAGSNTLTFAYSGGLQGLGDEGWKVNAVAVTTPVPEPETYAMMLAGLGLMGSVARRRKA